MIVEPAVQMPSVGETLAAVESTTVAASWPLRSCTAAVLTLQPGSLHPKLRGPWDGFVAFAWHLCMTFA